MLSLCSKPTERKIHAYAKSWESKGYPDGIPDEAPLGLESFLLVPSWRNICRALLKNDIQLSTLGYSREPCAMYKTLKVEELKQRGVIKVHCIQYGLFGDYYECF